MKKNKLLSYLKAYLQASKASFRLLMETHLIQSRIATLKNAENFRENRAAILVLQYRLYKKQCHKALADCRFRRLKARRLLPEDHDSEIEVEYFICYLENGRANTLQEAINVWEYELELEDQEQDQA